MDPIYPATDRDLESNMMPYLKLILPVNVGDSFGDVLQTSSRQYWCPQQDQLTNFGNLILDVDQTNKTRGHETNFSHPVLYDAPRYDALISIKV